MVPGSVSVNVIVSLDLIATWGAVYIDSGSTGSQFRQLVYEKDQRLHWTWSTCAYYRRPRSFMIINASL